MQAPVSEASGKSLFEVALRQAETPLNHLFERLAAPTAPSSVVSHWVRDFNTAHEPSSRRPRAVVRRGLSPIDHFYGLVSSHVYGDEQDVEKVKEALFARLSSARTYRHPTTEKNLVAMDGKPGLDGAQWREHLAELRRNPDAVHSLGLVVVAAMEVFQLGPNVLKLDTPMSKALNTTAELIDKLILGSAEIKTKNLATKPTLRCAFFAEPGFGKSYLLNYLLLGEDPMHCSTPNIQKSAASSGQGPCIKIKDMSGKETVSCDLAEATFEELPDKINDVLSSADNDAELQMVVVEYNFPVLRDLSVELLDLPGYPDEKVPRLAKTISSALVGTQEPDTVHRLHQCGAFRLDPLPRIVFIGNLKDDRPDKLPQELPPARIAEVRDTFEKTIAYFRSNSALHDLRELFSASFNLNPDITSQFVSTDRLPPPSTSGESAPSVRPRISIPNAVGVFVQIVTEARCLLFRTKEDIREQYGYDSKQKLQLLLDESRSSSNWWIGWPETIKVARPSSKLAKVLRELKLELKHLWGKGASVPLDTPTLERFLNEFDLFDDSYLPASAIWSNHMCTIQSCEKDLRALVACDKKVSVRRDKPLDSPFPEPKLYGVDGQMYSFPPRGRIPTTGKKTKRKAEYGVFSEPPENLQACIDRNYARMQEEFVTRGKNVLDPLLSEGKQRSDLANAVRLVSAETNQVTISLDRTLKIITVEQPAWLRDALGRVIQRAALSKDGQRGLYPIFISSEDRATPLREESSHWRPNLLADKLKLHPLLSYIIFCAVPSRELPRYQSWFPADANPGLIFISLPDSELGIGRIRTLFLLLAEQWRLSRFFMVDDDISEFHEYDPAIYIRGSIQHTSSTARALLFLQLTMDAELFPSDTESVRQRSEALLGIKAAYNRIIYQNEELDADDQARLVDQIAVSRLLEQVARDPTCLIRELEERNLGRAAQMVQQITKAKSQHVGQVALWNSLTCAKGYHDRLSGFHKSTHMISPIRYQVVLYNLEAVAGFHPVTDDAFWEEPLSPHARHELMRKVSRSAKQPYNAEELKLMRLGYKHSDAAYIKYLLLNNISGYMVYWFSFHHRVDKATRSLVNAEDTETDGTRITKGKKEKKAVTKPKTKGKLQANEKEQPIAGKGKKGKTTTTTKETKKQAGSVNSATPLRSAKPKKTKAKATLTKTKASQQTKSKNEDEAENEDFEEEQPVNKPSGEKKRKREIELTQEGPSERKRDHEGRPKATKRVVQHARKRPKPPIAFCNEQPFTRERQPVEETEDEQRP
ncbi:uncharacterized protein ACA1_052430 [Acanthamoeba castellanii str. Neff]|uniref:Uncharacterized protein n=1 Tax=Acanthamoeba castellanii (strain ATCC 30010 / Neff) TaxID=1257118 RepID=L8H5Q2_ACACF|nr:uncharacterized protein ACA1_052430 [Acanthamoeba castellanii str. Neff]ELR20552.1 hypothetical protein ACA1_052430 [Acanthamoeba castellanii str. Neff]